jgi:predicted aspartyl protease
MPEARIISKVRTEIGSDCSNNHSFDDECGSDVIKVFAITPLSKRELLTCPQIEVNVGNKIVKALIDSGSECNLINAELLQQLVDEGLEMLSLPISGCIIKGAFQSRTQRIRSQVLVDLYIHGIRYETILLVAPTLTMSVILGMQFLRSYCVSINFEEGYFEAKVNEERKKHVYLKTADQEGTVMSIRTAEFPLGVERGGKKELKGFYDEPTHITEMFKGFSGYQEVCRDGEKLCYNESEKCRLKGHEGDIGSHSENVRDHSNNNESLYANCATIDIESVEDAEFIGGEECEESKQIALYRCSVDMSPRAGDIFHVQRR